MDVTGAVEDCLGHTDLGGADIVPSESGPLKVVDLSRRESPLKVVDLSRQGD